MTKGNQIRTIGTGDRVEILRKDIFHLKHRKNRNGMIVDMDGGLVMVRPSWVKWEIELYAEEVRKI